MMQLAEKIADLIGYKGEIQKQFPKDYPFRPIVEDYLSLNSSKAESELGWRAKIDLEDGLKKSIEYWENVITGE